MTTLAVGSMRSGTGAPVFAAGVRWAPRGGRTSVLAVALAQPTITVAEIITVRRLTCIRLPPYVWFRPAGRAMASPRRQLYRAARQWAMGGRYAGDTRAMDGSSARAAFDFARDRGHFPNAGPTPTVESPHVEPTEGRRQPRPAAA